MPENKSEHMKKYDALVKYMANLGSAAVAFSAGADSSLLLCAAAKALGGGAVAVTAEGALFPKGDGEEGAELCRKLGVKRIAFEYDFNNVPCFTDNPPDRCYICKRAILSSIGEIASREGAKYVVEGSNADDIKDYRPGMKAVRELGVKSPLLELGFSKREVRMCLKELGIKAWNKPSGACLASRFAYSERITDRGLAMVGGGESFLNSILGPGQRRVRIHGGLARIEVEPDELKALVENRELILSRFKELGFRYVTADLAGYRTGSMNDAPEIEKEIEKKKKQPLF